MEPLEAQVAVVGAGAAGLYTALRAARHGAAVTLVSATPLAESSTYWAQGSDADISHGADLAATGYWFVAVIAVLNTALVIVMSARIMRASKQRRDAT